MKQKAPPAGYRVWKQSADYLYGWQWKCVADGHRGSGYSAKHKAMEAAEADAAFRAQHGKHLSEMHPLSAD